MLLSKSNEKHIIWFCIVKARIHCEIFHSEHFTKYSFWDISWNMNYFHEIPLLYSRLPVIRTSTRNKNLLRITEISNNWKFTLKWPISNYYKFFTALGHKKEVDLWNKMLRKSFPYKITKSFEFFEKINWSFTKREKWKICKNNISLFGNWSL